MPERPPRFTFAGTPDAETEQLLERAQETLGITVEQRAEPKPEPAPEPEPLPPAAELTFTSFTGRSLDGRFASASFARQLRDVQVAIAIAKAGR